MSNLFKSKFLLGMMIVAFVFVGFGLATTIAHGETIDTSCVLTARLAVGATGDQVQCLQAKLLMTKIDGKFGPMTKTAVKNFQTTNSLTADGIVGAMTRAALNSATAVVTPSQALCPNGMTLASNCTVLPTTTPSQDLCPNGMTLASNCSVLPGSIATGTTDGSITTGTSSYVSSGVQLKKGETKDVDAIRLTAAVGPVKVTRVDVNFNVRPWLFFNTISLHDSTGVVLATKTISSISDSTEVTVGSNYLVRFDNLNYTVNPGTASDLAVSVSVLPATDKITNPNMTVDAQISAIRTISEIGYTDSPSITNTLGGTSDGANTFTLLYAGSVADIYSRISPSSPASGQQVVSANQTTNDVTIASFDLKSASNSSTLNTLSLNILTSGSTLSGVLSNPRLIVGTQSIGGVLGTTYHCTGTNTSDTNSGTVTGCATGYYLTPVTFSNLTVALAQDVWTAFGLKVDLAQSAGGTVYASLVPAQTITGATGSPFTNIVGTDVNYNSLTTSNAGVVTSNVLTLTSNAVAISGITASLGSAIIQNNYTVGYNANYAFTLTNNSNNQLYVSATPGILTAGTAALGTYSITSTGGTTTGTGLGALSVNPSIVNGDDSGATYYAIPSGTSRTFTFSGAIYDNTAANTVTLKVTQINYATSGSVAVAGTGTGYANISTGLQGLSVTAHF